VMNSVVMRGAIPLELTRGQVCRATGKDASW